MLLSLHMNNVQTTIRKKYSNSYINSFNMFFCDLHGDFLRAPPTERLFSHRLHGWSLIPSCTVFRESEEVPLEKLYSL